MNFDEIKEALDLEVSVGDFGVNSPVDGSVIAKLSLDTAVPSSFAVLASLKL